MNYGAAQKVITQQKHQDKRLHVSSVEEVINTVNNQSTAKIFYQ